LRVIPDVTGGGSGPVRPASLRSRNADGDADAVVAVPPNTAADFTDFVFTVSFITSEGDPRREPNDPLRNMNLGWAEAGPYTIRIWERPIFRDKWDIENIGTTAAPIDAFRLPDGMVGPGPGLPTEPVDTPYAYDYTTGPAGIATAGVNIEAIRLPAERNATGGRTEEASWVWNTISQPIGGLTDVRDSDGSLRIHGIPTGTGTGHNGGIFNFTVSFNVISAIGNENIGTATVPCVVSHPFTMWIWPRTYLNVISVPVSFVRRISDFTYDSTPAGIWDINWAVETSHVWTPDNHPPYLRTRAVMPGTQAVIDMDGVFVRWEVRSASSTVDIGNNWRQNGNTQYVLITMPTTRLDDNGEVEHLTPASPVAQLNVTIHGVVDVRPIIRETLIDGFENLEYSGSFLVTNPLTLGAGPLTPRWDWNENALSEVPNGLVLDPTAGVITGTPANMPGLTPLQHNHTFSLIVGLTLRGSMRVEYTFPLTIRPDPGLLIGDVDGRDLITLVDLVLLDAHLRRPTIVILPNPNASNIEPPFSPPGRAPTTTDLNRLAEFFAVGRPLTP
jgi:hypothetical protein